jgi:hypothetical protein
LAVSESYTNLVKKEKHLDAEILQGTDGPGELKVACTHNSSSLWHSMEALIYHKGAWLPAGSNRVIWHGL